MVVFGLFSYATFPNVLWILYYYYPNILRLIFQSSMQETEA